MQRRSRIKAHKGKHQGFSYKATVKATQVLCGGGTQFSTTIKDPDG